MAVKKNDGITNFMYKLLKNISLHFSWVYEKVFLVHVVILCLIFEWLAKLIPVTTLPFYVFTCDIQELITVCLYL